MKNINPAEYNLHARTKLLEKNNKIFIIIDRKSRIIMKDGHRILEIANKIKSVKSEKNVGVMSNAPVCSKTQKFLINNGIVVKGL